MPKSRNSEPMPEFQKKRKMPKREIYKPCFIAQSKNLSMKAPSAANTKSQWMKIVLFSSPLHKIMSFSGQNAWVLTDWSTFKQKNK